MSKIATLARLVPRIMVNGLTTIAAATNFLILQTIIANARTDPRQEGDIFIDLNINGNASGFHNRGLANDQLSYQLEIAHDGVNYEVADMNSVFSVGAAGVGKEGIVIKNFFTDKMWRVRALVDVDRGEYIFPYYYMES